MIGEAMKSFVIDHWYKATLVISTGFLVLALTAPLQVPNRAVAGIALGGLLFSLGQWINHPLQVRVVPGWKIEGHPRNATFGGVALEIVGTLIAAYGIWLLLRG